MHTADSSSSSLSSIGDVEVSPPLEEGLLDDSFAKDAPSYDVPVKQKKMSRNAGRKQAVRALCLFFFYSFQLTCSIQSICGHYHKPAALLANMLHFYIVTTHCVMSLHIV